MSINCNEINLVLKELDLEGAFIQDIIQPGYDTLALYTYKEGNAKTLLICTEQNSVRINETRRKITKNDKPLRFMEFLRSRIKGCRINSCRQIGLERVIKMELSHSPEETFNLYIRLWNNAANVIVCDNTDLVLETMFRRPERFEVKDEVFIPPAVDEEKITDSEDRFPVRDWKSIVEENFESKESDLNKQAADKVKNPLYRPETFNQFLDWWYSEHASTLSRQALLEKAEKWFNINHSKKEAAIQSLEKKLEEFKNAGQFKHQGDLILSFGHLLDGKSNFLECEDYESGKTIRIAVNPDKSAQENAAEYYKNYKKAVSGSEDLAHDIEIAKKALEKLEAQYEEIKNEKNPVKIEQLLRKDTTPKQKQKKNHPGLDYTIKGWYILVGRDANENDGLLRHHVRGEDLWLHVRDFPGGYVFIKARKGKTVPLEILLDAANLAVHYSKARNNTKVDLYYTHVKYLRRAKNGPKGLVIPTQEKNLCITPDKKRISALDEYEGE
ncbi:MAG: NFACT RNA binding domain-containing protein [Treponema sp.]|nr:NFACT RNA binding domain-containing protein [Treponema sp.]